jgi:peroxiredoxin
MVEARVRGPAARVGRRFGWFALVAVLVLGSACDPPVEAGPALPVGTEDGYRMPPLAGVLPDGESFDVADDTRSPTVLVFYRGADCGLCRVRLEQLQEHLPAYRTSGARVVAVTLDPPEVTAALAERMGLDFTIVSVSPDVFERWQVMHPEQEIPLPASFIVDRAGTIRHRHIGRNAADRASDAGLLTILETLDVRA